MKTSPLLAILPAFAASLPSTLPLGDVTKRSYESFSRLETASANFDPNGRLVSRLQSRALGDSTQNDVRILSFHILQFH